MRLCVELDVKARKKITAQRQAVERMCDRLHDRSKSKPPARREFNNAMLPTIKPQIKLGGAKSGTKRPPQVFGTTELSALQCMAESIAIAPGNQIRRDAQADILGRREVSLHPYTSRGPSFLCANLTIDPGVSFCFWTVFGTVGSLAGGAFTVQGAFASVCPAPRALNSCITR